MTAISETCKAVPSPGGDPCAFDPCGTGLNAGNICHPTASGDGSYYCTCHFPDWRPSQDALFCFRWVDGRPTVATSSPDLVQGNVGLDVGTAGSVLVRFRFDQAVVMYRADVRVRVDPEPKATGDRLPFSGPPADDFVTVENFDVVDPSRRTEYTARLTGWQRYPRRVRLAVTVSPSQELTDLSGEPLLLGNASYLVFYIEPLNPMVSCQASRTPAARAPFPPPSLARLPSPPLGTNYMRLRSFVCAGPDIFLPDKYRAGPARAAAHIPVERGRAGFWLGQGGGHFG